MNNPFTSDRNIFSNIAKPITKNTQQAQKNNMSQANNLPLSNATSYSNPTNNMSSVVKPYSNHINSSQNQYANPLKSTSNNLQGNRFSSGQLTDNYIEEKKQVGEKIDLNFRGQFRNNLNNNSNNLANFHINQINNEQNKVISDRQFPSYQSANSNKNLLFVNQQKTIITSKNDNPNFNSFGIANLPMQQKSTDKQKITFGISNNRNGDDKIQYDRSQFVHRNQLYQMDSSNGLQNQYTRLTRQQAYPVSKNRCQSPLPNQNKNLGYISMSPIEQHSQHKIEQQSFLDLDAMGDDIEKILANSKNQDELYRLLGIQGYAQDMKKAETQKQVQVPQNRVTISPTYENQGPEKNTHDVRVQKIDMLNKNVQENYLQAYEQQQVFDYEVDNSYFKKMSAPQKKYSQQTKTNYMNPLNPVQTNAQQSMRQSRSSVGQLNEGVKMKENPYVCELQQLIDSQMKKLSTNGKIRTFLSAAQKIQTTKYNLEYI